jgi:c-di-GMP-binding flagellar brake protein YcgR
MADPSADLAITGRISRAPEEIARLLAMLAARGEPVRSSVGAGGRVTFESRIRFVDPARAYIILEPAADQAANRALLERPGATFYATPGAWRIEFSAAKPEAAQHEGRVAIRLRFPEILSSRQNRAHERVAVQPQAPLHFLADAGGVISFDGYMVDISEGGIGMLQYAADITLEPGTLLKGCRVEPPGRAPVHVDLEVRYSAPVTLPDGTRAVRSGCRFVDPSPDVKTLLTAYFSR